MAPNTNHTATDDFELLARAQLRHVGCHIPAIGFEQHAVPFLERVVVKIEARVLLKMRRAQQDALWRIGPAVQRANKIAAHAFGGVV